MYDLTDEDILLIKTLLSIEFNQLNTYLLKNRFKDSNSDDIKYTISTISHINNLLDKLNNIKF